MTTIPNFDGHDDQTPGGQRGRFDPGGADNDRTTGATDAESVDEASGDELAASVQRFLAMVDEIDTVEAFEAEVSDQRAPRLVLGGLASLCADAMEEDRTDEEAAAHIESLQPTPRDIEEFSLSDTDLENIAEVREAIAQMLLNEADIPSAGDIEAQTGAAVDEVIDQIGPQLNNPTGELDRDLLLISTYREQLFHLVVLHLLSEEVLNPLTAAE